MELSPCVATVVVNNWENIPRQTNISIRAQTLLQGPRWWEELLLAKYSESGPAQLWPCTVSWCRPDINDRHTISSEKGDKKVVSPD